MSRNSPKQYAEHLEALGRPVPRPVDISGVRTAPTVRPEAPEVSPAWLRIKAHEMRQDASRMLARANDLEAAAKRLEGE